MRKYFNEIEVVAKPLGMRASCPHFSNNCGRDARVPRNFAITSIVKLFVLTMFAAVQFLSATQVVGETIEFPGSEPLGDPSSVIKSNAPSMPNSFFPFTSSSGNSVTVRSGAVGGHVFGGIAADSGANSINNIVSIEGGTIGTSTTGGNVFGGWTYDSNVTSNSVVITNATARGIIFGGWLNGGTGGNVEQNSVTIGSGTTARDNIYGGYSQGQNGEISGNQIIIAGGTVTKTDAIIAGGYSAILLNAVSGNSVVIDGGTINNARIYGGRGQVNSVITGNRVEVNGGTISNGAIFGGQNINNGAVNLNRVEITGGTVNATVYGGNSGGSSAVTGNMVEITGGVVTGDIYGGYSNRGSAVDNVVTIGGTANLGTGFNLFGGYVNTGGGDVFTGNILNKNNAANVGVARNFEFVNFGYSGDANIGTLSATPTGSVRTGVTLNTAAYNINFGGDITGTGNLTKTGTGTLILGSDGNNIQSGNVRIQEGTLQLGGGGATGSIVASGGFNVDAGATLAFNHSNNITETQRITGDGKVVQNGTGTLTLSNASNSFGGGTEIESGTLRIADQYSLGLAMYSGKYGYITFTGATGTKVAELGISDPSGVALTNSFRTQTGAGNDNNVDLRLSPNSWIMAVNIADKGGAFHVADGTTMNVAANYLGLAGNMANGQLNDLYVGAGGTFNLTTSIGAGFFSGIDGEGTLNLFSGSPASLVQFLNEPAIPKTFQMGTTNVTGTGDNAIVLNLTRGGLPSSSRVVFNNTDAFNLEGDGSFPSAYLMGDGIVKAGAGGINVSGQGGLAPLAALADSEETLLLPGTLTLEAPAVNLDGFGLIYMVDSQQSSLDFDAQGIPVSNNSLLNITSDAVNMSDGTVFFHTTSGTPFTQGDYLVIRSSDGFSNIGNNIELNHQLSTIMVDGFQLNSDSGSPRGGYGFKFGGDPDTTTGVMTAGTENVWFGHSLNSLSMAWTGDGGTAAAPAGGDWTKGDFFFSLQEESGVHERQFLTGDKVYISGTDTFNINLPVTGDSTGLSNQKIIVSGLVVGQDFDGNNTSGGNYTISGEGGITADRDSAFGNYLDAGLLTPTGKLQKYGDSTLKFTNTGGNTFNEGIELYGGSIQFTQGNQLGRAAGTTPGTKAGYLTFAGDAGRKDVILQNPGDVFMTNSFRTQSGAGDGNNIDLAGSHLAVISDIEIADDGGAFYVADGTTMNVAAGNLYLLNNLANGGLNDLYVESGGTFNMQVNSTDLDNPSMAVFASGIDGEGTLNISANGPGSVVFLSDYNDKFHMGTTNVAGSRDNIAVLFLERLDSSGSPRLTFENTGGFNVTGDGTPISAVLMGDGIVKADVINVTNGAALSPTDKGAPGTLTLDSPMVNLDDFALLYRAYPTTRLQEPLDITTDPGGIPFSNNTLLNIISADATLNNGTVYFQTADGTSFAHGDYLVIRTSDGFSNIVDNADLNSKLSNAMVDGFQLNTGSGSPRGEYGFKLGGDPDSITGGITAGTESVWFEHNLNSLSMAWTGDGGTEIARVGGDWISGDFFYSQQDESGKHERRFLTGDKVYISGTDTLRIDLPAAGDSLGLSDQRIIVSGLVVGQDFTGNNAPGGNFTISGEGGITANQDSAFGKYLDAGQLTPTGKLQKYGDSTLTFTNTGGNMFNEGIDLYGGAVEFTQANQLGDGGKGIKFLGNSTLHALDNVTLVNDIEIVNDDVTGGFGAAEGAVFTYAGNLTGSIRTVLEKTGKGTLRLETPVSPSLFLGSMIVSNGMLDVAGDYGNTASFTVKNGATLTGTGIIGAMSGVGGVIESGGTLKPNGISGSPFTVNGNLKFNAGSNLDIRAQYSNGVWHNDQVKVNGGAVSIDPAANLNVDIDYWGTAKEAADSGHFTVIDASEGTASNVLDKFELHYSGLPRGVTLEQGWRGASGNLFQLWLTSDPGTGFGRIFTGHNRSEIGKNLDELVENKDPGLRDLIDRLSDQDLSDQEIGVLLDQLHGDLTPNAFFLALKEPWRRPFNRLASSSPYGALRNYGRSQSRVWGEFVGQYESTGYDGNAHDFTMERYGLAIGADYQLFPRSITGVTFQYANPRLSQETGTVKADDYEFGLYNMTGLMDNLDLKAYLGYSYQQYDFSRAVSLPASPSGGYEAFSERLNGSSNGHALAASVELVRPVQLRHNIRLMPVAAIDFEKAWIDGYRESSGETSLVYDDASMERVMLRFGMDSELNFQNGLYLKPKAQYAKQINDQKYPSAGARFINATLPDQRTADIWGSQIGRSYWNTGISGGWRMDSQGDKVLYMNYDAKWYDLSSSHTGTAGLMIRW